MRSWRSSKRRDAGFTSKAWTCVGFAILSCLNAAQGPPDFSGRWSLVTPGDRAETVEQSLASAAADELIITQTASSLSVRHLSTGGSLPSEGMHRFGSSGIVAGSGDRSERHAFWFGRQLILGTTLTSHDSQGQRRVRESSEVWTLNSRGQLTIEISATGMGDGPRTITFVYRRQ